jgi:rhamnulokinase
VLSLFEGVLQGLTIAGREPVGSIRSAVDSWAVDFGLLDRSGQLIQNPVQLP